MKLMKQLLEAHREIPMNIVRDYQERAEAERQAGGSIEIDSGIPSVYVKMSSGEDYFFQEHEADKILKTVPANISAEDFILATAQSW